MTANPWHKGSRYWRFGMYVVLLSVLLSIYFNTPSPFLAIGPVFLAGAGGANVAERFKASKLENQ